MDRRRLKIILAEIGLFPFRHCALRSDAPAKITDKQLLVRELRKNRRRTEIPGSHIGSLVPSVGNNNIRAKVAFAIGAHPGVRGLAPKHPR